VDQLQRPARQILLSPAHHQIHHSADPAHYDRNFGSSLALFDRMFGTLHVPARKREQLRFGVPELRYDPHTLQGCFVRPFMDATASLKTRIAGKLIIGTETEHAR
jgi:sterol desaturase/sphingolipid hydroxylase (fatty acid hydroxylase superfamily)